MARRDPESGVQADFIPDGEEEAFQEDPAGDNRDPESGVVRDFIPQGDAEVGDVVEPGGQEQALRNAVEGDRAAVESDDAPQKFQGPVVDQLGRREPVDQEPEGQTAVEREEDAAQGRDPEEAPERVGDGAANTEDDGLVVDGGGGATPVEEVVGDDEADEAE